MNEVDCPYCEHTFELDTDDGAYLDQSETEEAECPECEKIFLVSSSISWYHTGYKADCLNGADHEWRGWQSLYTDKHGPHKGQSFYRRQCGSCDKSETKWDE